MSFLISLLIIFYSITACRTEPFVVTKYKEGTLAAYYEIAEKFTEGQREDEFSVEGYNFSNYCYQLRNARIFQIANEGTSLRNVFPGIRLTQTILNEERTQTLTKSRDLEVKKSMGYQNLPSFKCSDHQGRIKWFVTLAFFPDSAFLFETDFTLQYLHSRETGSRREIIPKLTALIDYPVELSSLDMSYEKKALVKRFLNTYDSNTTKKDQLCSLNNMLQYRLCAITVNHMENDLHKFVTYHKPSSDDNKSCPSMKIVLTYGTVIRKRLLYCHTVFNSHEATNNRVYLSSSATLAEVFVFKKSAYDRRDVELIKVLKIPLLKHLNRYEEMFRVNENIEL